MKSYSQTEPVRISHQILHQKHHFHQSVHCCNTYIVCNVCMYVELGVYFLAEVKNGRRLEEEVELDRGETFLLIPELT